MAIDRDARDGRDAVLSKVTDDVLVVTVNRPEQRNALSRDVIRALADTFAAQAGASGLRAAILTGSGDRAFAAGGDLKELATLRAESDIRAFSVEVRRALDRIREFPVPVIAALNGPALGGGAELAMACDFRVAAREAAIGFLQGKLAITTAWGGGIDLMQLVGPTRGLELLLSSQVLTATEAMGVGLVDRMAEGDETAVDAALRLLSAWSHQKPQVIRGFKAMALAMRHGEDRAGLEAVETDQFAATWLHDDHWEAADAAMARISRASPGRSV